MVNTIELKKAMLDAGYSQRELAARSNIAKNVLNRKINNKGVFNADEITVLCECLNITDPARKCEIFLA